MEQHGPRADAPPKVYGSTTLAIGPMIGGLRIEVGLYTGMKSADESVRNSFVECEDGFHEIGSMTYDKKLSKPEDNEFVFVQRDAIVKGKAVGDGQVVVITDAELNSFGLDRAESPVQIVRRPTGEAARWIIPTQIYQARVRPKTVGKSKVPNKPQETLFALLLAALERLDAVAFFPLRMKEAGAGKWGMLDCHGRVSLLQYGENLRAELPLPDIEVTDGALGKMTALLEKFGLLDELPATPDLRGSHVEQLIMDKLAGKEVKTVIATTEGSAADDVEALLTAALGA